MVKSPILALLSTFQLFLMKPAGFFLVLALATFFHASGQQSRFERSNGAETATYFEAIEWYRQLDRTSSKITLQTMGATDAGYPLHLVLVSTEQNQGVAQWKKAGKIIILINNGIHPGEPDGIDASMLLVRDIALNKVKLPANVALAFIPVYNIGGSLNRGSFSRVNQNGPTEYGFRGNSQNLDLNRDFTKCDSKEARSFTDIFHLLDPDILVDNHVSDGADYQHTMTLITTQYDKLGQDLGGWLKKTFEPALYGAMSGKGWDMAPYVDFEKAGAEMTMQMFYDPPRYSSGYAALFQTIGFIPETHMLKPYKDRVQSTYALMVTMAEMAGKHADTLRLLRRKARAEIQKQQTFPLTWRLDTTRHSQVRFQGYEQGFTTSETTGLQRMFYDHSKPYTRQVRFFDVFRPENIVGKPVAYLIPQGWHEVIDRLKLNKVTVERFKKDTVIEVSAYRIDDYKSSPRPYEKHHKNSGVKVTASLQKVKFLKGDCYIPLNQPANRYIVEMLEPTGDDSFFAWNFFDAILQQKEGYSDYRWEDVAAAVLKKNPALQDDLLKKKAADTSFARNASAQLDFIYKRSPYYEPAHLRYPVYRLLQ